MMNQETGTTRRRRIIKDSAKYLTATIIGQGIGLIRAVLLPVIFSPSQLGIWSLMNVIIGYGANAHVGLLDGMNKAIPLLRTQNNLEAVERIKDSVFWLNLLLGGLAGVAVCFASWVWPGVYGMGLRIVAGIIFLQLIFYYFFSLLRADNRFGLISIGVAGLSVASTLLILGLAVKFQDRLCGALLGFMAAYGLIVAYWMIKSGYKFVFQCRFDAIGRALKLGVPLIILGISNTIYMSVDRWMIAVWLDETRLGYYALGFMGCNLLALVPTSVASVLYPRILESFAVNQDPRAARGLLTGPLQALAVLMLIAVSTAVIILPLLIHVFIPKFLPSVPVIMILIPGAFFISLMPLAANYLVAINWQNLIIAGQVLITIFFWAGDYGMLTRGYGIMGVALVTVVGYSILSLSYILIAVIKAEGQKRKALLFLGRLVFPFVAVVLAIAAIDWLIPTVNARGEYGTLALVRLGFLMIVLGPALWLANRDGELMSIVRSEWKHRFG